MDTVNTPGAQNEPRAARINNKQESRQNLWHGDRNDK